MGTAVAQRLTAAGFEVLAYDIDAANREYDATVRSPNSTLGIRGTHVSLLDQRPFPPEAVSLTGVAQFQSFKKQAVAFGGKNVKTKIDSEQGTAANTALAASVLDPRFTLARDWLINAHSPAHTGLLQLVPPKTCCVPFKVT